MTERAEGSPRTLTDRLAPDWQVPSSLVRSFRPVSHRYALGIPVLNENGRIRAQLEVMHAVGVFSAIDVVIADGGSVDGSVDADWLDAHGVRALLIKTGAGRLSAQLRMFFAFAMLEGYEGVVIVDGNNKDGPDGVFAMVAALEAGFDFVQGSRYRPGGREENTPWTRKLGVRYLHAPILSLASRYSYTDTTNGFRALSRRLLLDERVRVFRDVFDTYNLHYYVAMMAPRLGFRVCEVPVTRIYPPEGPAPTKIKGVRANVHVLMQLLQTVCNRYAPR